MLGGYWLRNANEYTTGGNFLHLPSELFTVDVSKTERIAAPLEVATPGVVFTGSEASSTVRGGVGETRESVLRLPLE